MYCSNLIYLSIWIYLNLSSLSSLSESIWIYLNLSESIWIYLNLSESIWIYLNLSESIWIYLNLSESIWIYLNLSICLSELSVYLSAKLSIETTSVLCQSWQLKTEARSARLPQFLILTTIKNESILRDFLNLSKLTTIKKEAILRDFLNFWTWQRSKMKSSLRDFSNFSKLTTSKRSNSARLPPKMESWVQSWRPRTNAFCNFSTPCV